MRYGIDTPMPTGVIEQWLLPFRGMGSPLVVAVRHPWRSVKAPAGAAPKALLRDMRWSMPRASGTRRPLVSPKVPDT